MTPSTEFRLIAACAALVLSAHAAVVLASERVPAHVRSRDGTRIAFECAGAGPELLIVHGGTGDRTRWTPLFPLLERDFTVCAMDRRAHGESGDGPRYGLRREAEDVVAVVDSRRGPVAVLGHSFGAVVAYEAARMSPRISRLLLYEPPIQVDPHVATLQSMETLIRAGDREAAAKQFMREVVGVSPDELTAMQTRRSWPALVATIDTSGAPAPRARKLPVECHPVRGRKLKPLTALLVGELTTSGGA
ncbi:MAG: alpha/beta hydrolase [Steroidobacteraceae bacterium]